MSSVNEYKVQSTYVLCVVLDQVFIHNMVCLCFNFYHVYCNLVLDATTASGMEPDFVADCVHECVHKPRNELLLADFKSYLGVLVRCLCTPLYFKFMEAKAKKEAGIYKKKT